MTAAQTFRVTLARAQMHAIPVPFDPKPVFGKVRAPVTVTVNGYTYRSTIAAMGGPLFVPFRRSHREAAGITGDATVTITLALDTKPRVITPPKDLAKALKAKTGAWERWKALSYSHQREYAEAVAEAKKPETRARRIAGAVTMIAARPAPRR